MESILTAGVAVLLTILTFFSTPILTSVFGDGSLEVKCHSYVYNTGNVSFISVLMQGEDTEDWAYDQPVEKEVNEPTTNNDPLNSCLPTSTPIVSYSTR